MSIVPETQEPRTEPEQAPLNPDLWHSRGFNVIPLRDKIPIGRWRHWTIQRQSPDDVKSLFAVNDLTGMGVILGSFGRLAILDIDGPAGERVLCEHGIQLPRTWEVRTHRGRHLWFRIPDDQNQETIRRVSHKLELKAERGGFAIVPPSLHPDGCRYTWIVSPEEAERADLPKALVEFLASLPVRPTTPSNPETEEPALSPQLRTALLFWQQGFQVIPLDEHDRPLIPVKEWERIRQTRDDVKRLFNTAQCAGVGILKYCSNFRTVAYNVNSASAEQVLNQDIARSSDGTARFTGKFALVNAIKNGQLPEPQPSSPPTAGRVSHAKVLVQPQASTDADEDALRKLFANEKVLEKVLPVLGIPVDAVPDPAGREEKRGGKAFCCVLHPEEKPSAQLGWNENGGVVYLCYHGRDDYFARTLPEVYYAQQTGEPKRLRGAEFAVWAMKLLETAAGQDPVHVDLPALPDFITTATRQKVYDGLARLFSIRWTYEPGVPITFSWRFAAAWCGVHQVTAHKAVEEFKEWRVIHPVERRPGPFIRSIEYYMPGPKPVGFKPKVTVRWRRSKHIAAED